ncbi:glutathione peroxidase [Enterococcus sp. AZ194]|uniref:glutathione peroxidase n=1 Tax=Enterococcus sp. AZ194 TaxID=2774629 RepID=UPI003F2501F2
MTIYEFKVKQTNDEMKSLSDYQGDVLLIVNTATGCGFTPQYEGLQNLYEKHQAEGFEILDFPCNQFGNQAPGTNQEITEFCQLTYHTTFQTFAKIKVNGDDADPLYKYLKSAQGGLLGKTIKWNFTKFLVNRKGEVIKRYASTVKPEDIEADVLVELAK